MNLNNIYIQSIKKLTFKIKTKFKRLIQKDETIRNNN